MKNKSEIKPEEFSSYFPDLPGLSVRHYRGPSDHEHIQRVFNGCKQVDGVKHTLKLESINHHFKHLERSDPRRDMIFVEIHGEPIGYARVGWYPEDTGDHIYYSLGWVLPEYRHRGIGTAMLSFCESRSREIAAGHPGDSKKFFQSGYDDSQEECAQLLEGNGYRKVRWFYEMCRDIAESLPTVTLPEGFGVRPVPQDRYRDIFDAQNEAFRDHWGHVEATEEDFQRFLSLPTLDPELWKVAWHGEDVAGMVLNFINPEENEEYNRLRGYTENISVRKPFRRQGIARYLLVESIKMFRDLGMKETALGVDARNPNQALDLYLDVGYQIMKTSYTCRKAIDHQ